MKIYVFEDHWNGTFSVREIEVEEKPKTYIAIKSGYYHSRISKDNINKLERFGNMYCLSPDPTIYINAMIARAEKRLQAAKERMQAAEAELKKWNDIKGGAANG